VIENIFIALTGAIEGTPGIALGASFL